MATVRFDMKGGHLGVLALVLPLPSCRQAHTHRNDSSHDHVWIFAQRQQVLAPGAGQAHPEFGHNLGPRVAVGNTELGSKPRNTGSSWALGVEWGGGKWRRWDLNTTIIAKKLA